MGAFLLGLGVGMVGGMLMAPRPGRYYREILSDKASEGAGYLRAKTEGIRGSASDAVDKSREAMSRQIEKFAAKPQPAEVYNR